MTTPPMPILNLEHIGLCSSRVNEQEDKLLQAICSLFISSYGQIGTYLRPSTDFSTNSRH